MRYCACLNVLQKTNKSKLLTKVHFMKKKLLLIFLSTFFLIAHAIAQQNVTGRVTSSDGAIPGVSVRVKGTSIVSQTNSTGFYSIKAQKTDILIFSYIGYLSQEQSVNGKAIINVVLKTDSKVLNDVVVTAYGVDRDKKSLGYSTPVVKGDEVSETQRDDMFAGLQGRVPGLSINSTSGNPGASSQIILRGFVSVSGDNNALIVVDGVPIDNSTLNQTNELVTGGANRDQDYSNRGGDINPADIESYTIMKGPEATAMFGNAGASGAILITTKKGSSGRGTINYNNAFRFETLSNFPERQLKYNSGTNGVFSGTISNFHGPEFLPTTQLYDNVNAFFQTARSNKHNLSFEGGSEKVTYRWSNEYSDAEGTTPFTSYKRLTSRLTGVATISPILKLNTSFAYINTTNDKANKGANGSLLQLMRFSPAFDVTQYEDQNGKRLLHLASIYSEYDNPIWDVVKNKNKDETNRVMMSSNLEFKPNKWLRVTGIFGADVGATSGMRVQHPQSYLGSGSAASPTGGRIETYDKLVKYFNASLTASARHSFGDFNNTYILGVTGKDYEATTNSIVGTNFYDPDFYSINNTLPATHKGRNYVNNYRNIGAFAQAVLGYKSLMYLTFTGRLDGASRLMPNNPYFAYPSVSYAFNFSDLKSVRNAIPALNNGKFRISYALTGKEPWREYATGSNYAGAATSGGGYAYSYYGGNPDLKPERSENFETGVELQFFKNRLGFDFNYYNLLSKDQIINPRFSYGRGFVLQMINGGTIRNRGVEAQITGRPIDKKDFTWNVTVNYALNRGKVLALANQLPELYDSDTWILSGVRSAVHPGSSTSALSATRFDRNANGDIIINPATGLPTSSDTQYYPVADRAPKYNIGISNRFRYKNWNLSFLWDIRYGGDVLNGTEYELYTKGISIKTLDRENPRVVVGVLADGLQHSANPTKNTIGVTPYYTSTFYSTTVEPEMFIEKNIKTLRLRDVSLSYDFPQSVIKRTKFFQSLGAYVVMTDAVLFTNYSGKDPESNSNTPGLGGIGGYGIDYGNVGKPLVFTFGVRFKL
jgi:ferric enterobactin receptor